MKLIICIDKKNGMLFNSRRQSQDEEVRNKIKEITSGAKLWMNKYSSEQFSESSEINISETFLREAGENDYCFVENVSIPTEGINEIILYKWNRNYPADTFFEFDLKKNGFKKVSKIDFIGKSHEEITEEIWKI